MKTRVLKFVGNGFLLLLMGVTDAKVKEAMVNSGYTNVYLTINGPLKTLSRHFWYFYCSIFKMTFVKNFMKKQLVF